MYNVAKLAQKYVELIKKYEALLERVEALEKANKKKENK
jgi:hypothetical protein